MTKPTPRMRIIAPVLAIGVSVVIVQAASATRSLQLDQRIDGARGAVQDLVHVGASRVAAETEPTAPTESAPAKPARIPEADRRLLRPGREAQSSRPARRADTLPKRRLRGQSVPDFAAIQEDARKRRDTDVGEPSGRRPPR